MRKPDDVYDRVDEWETLAGFAQDASPGASLAIVYGRRRQGKSFLLSALCEQSGGFYFEATEDVEPVLLERLGRELATYTGAVAPLTLRDWPGAFDALLALGRERPVTVVLDELPYLIRSSPSLASVIQAAFGPRRRQRLQSRTRLVLCGSALAVMGGLLSGQAPLRGRASAETVINTFDFRDARGYWGIEDLRLAVMLHAVVGGTPAYKELLRGHAPTSERTFGDWVCRAVLDPSSPLQREARYLFAEDLAEAREPSLYHSILGAVALGKTTPSQVAAQLGRASSDLNHPLEVLEDAGLIRKMSDAVFDRKPTLQVREPILSFYYAVMRPVWPQLERVGTVHRAWAQQRETFSSQILGPHFEQLCRDWAGSHAGAATFQTATIHYARQIVIRDGKNGRHEVDVAVVGADSAGARRLVSIGEAKWSQRMTPAHLERLRQIRAALVAKGKARHDVVLVCYSGLGFDTQLISAAEADEVVLVDLERIYHGS